MFLRSKAKYLLFLVTRILRREKLPAKRRDFRVLGTVVGREGRIPAVLQNISETGLCFVIQEAGLPEEFIISLQSPLERKERSLRCRKVWAKRFEADGRAYVRVGCSFNDHSFRLRWLANYLTDDLTPPEASEAEAEAA